MPQRVAGFLVVLSALFVLPGCGRTPPLPPANEGNNDKQVVERPVPPLQIAIPAALSEKLDGKDLKAMDALDLLISANQAMTKEDYPRAAALQYWYVQKAKTGQYNLACFLAQMGQTEPAFYWLQVAALEEGVDGQHAQRDEDLVSLRRDPRWQKVRQYLEDCNRYFESAPIGHTLVVLPKDYQKGTPIPAVIWLHGLGSRPDGFINNDCQDFANKLNVAMIGVSGTKPRGPRSFVWAENAVRDGKRLRDALAEVSDRVTVKKGRVITFGFSQGAQVGLEVAVSYPDEYAGSIALSPGGVPHLEDLKSSPLLAKRGFVVSCAAKEHPGNVQLTALDADWLRRANAQVIHKVYAGACAHSFPSDFDQRFPVWVKFILKSQAE